MLKTNTTQYTYQNIRKGCHKGIKYVKHSIAKYSKTRYVVSSVILSSLLYFLYYNQYIPILATLTGGKIYRPQANCLHSLINLHNIHSEKNIAYQYMISMLLRIPLTSLIVRSIYLKLTYVGSYYVRHIGYMLDNGSKNSVDMHAHKVFLLQQVLNNAKYTEYRHLSATEYSQHNGKIAEANYNLEQARVQYDVSRRDFLAHKEALILAQHIQRENESRLDQDHIGSDDKIIKVITPWFTVKRPSA